MFWNLRRPFKHKIIAEYCRKKGQYVLLDVGCGRFSPGEFKKSFPECAYYAVDYLPIDFGAEKFVDGFYQMDLNNNDLQEIPDAFFDVIVLSHVIEHLENGCEVIQKLLSKLKPEGIIYIEYPSVNSLKLPSMPDTLNFCDDPGHISLYSIRELCSLLLKADFRILKAGIRRDYYRIMIMPLAVIWQLFRYRKVFSYTLWDACGFAEYVVAGKK